MRVVWRWLRGSEAALGLVVFLVAVGGAFGVVEWMMSAERGCAPQATAPICDESVKGVVVPIGVFGPLLMCGIAMGGIKLSSVPVMPRWALAGVVGSVLCLLPGIAIAAAGA